MTWREQKHEAWTALSDKMHEEAMTQIRKAAIRELVLGKERLRQEIEQARENRVEPRQWGRRRGVGGIKGEQTGHDFDQL